MKLLSQSVPDRKSSTDRTCSISRCTAWLWAWRKCNTNITFLPKIRYLKKIFLLSFIIVYCHITLMWHRSQTSTLNDSYSNDSPRSVSTRCQKKFGRHKIRSSFQTPFYFQTTSCCRRSLSLHIHVQYGINVSKSDFASLGRNTGFRWEVAPNTKALWRRGMLFFSVVLLFNHFEIFH